MKLRPFAFALFAASALAVTLTPAKAASFNCAHAILAAEEAICGNSNLSRLDEQTAGMYFIIVGSGAPQATINQVKASQRKFIEQRNACGTNIDCLVDAYTSQIMFLKNEKSNLGL
jgi:uncharacterized protein